jgi:hypothetical protein
MKKLALLLAFIVSAASFVPTAAQAGDRHRYHHHDGRRVAYHCRACGDSVYQQRFYAGRDRYRRPIYTWRTVSHRCRPYHHYHHHQQGDRNRWIRTGGSIYYGW